MTACVGRTGSFLKAVRRFPKHKKVGCRTCACCLVRVVCCACVNVCSRSLFLVDAVRVCTRVCVQLREHAERLIDNLLDKDEVSFWSMHTHEMCAWFPPLQYLPRSLLVCTSSSSSSASFSYYLSTICCCLLQDSSRRSRGTKQQQHWAALAGGGSASSTVLDHPDLVRRGGDGEHGSDGNCMIQ